MANRKNQGFLSGNSNVRNRFKVFRMIIFAILLLVTTIGIVICTGSMEDVVEGQGTVIGIRDYEIKSLVTAKVAKVYSHEGAEVKSGTLLLEFDSRDLKNKISALRHSLTELKKEQEVKEQELKILIKDPLPDHYRHTKLQLEEAQKRFARNQHELQVYSDLYKRKTITRQEFLKVELEHLSSQMSLRRLTEDWKKLQSGLAKDILNKANTELVLLKKRIAGKELEIEIATRQLDDYKLYAPDDGVLTEIPPRPGGFYTRGEVVIKFSANRNKKVVALINEKQIYKVAAGQSVRIYSQQYNYLDYGFFSGKVTDIYQLPVQKDGVNYYPVRIIITDEHRPLRFGAGCEVSIVTGRDRIVSVLLGIRDREYREWRASRQPQQQEQRDLTGK